MSEQKAQYNPWQAALETFDAASELLDLDENIRERIRYPERELTFNFPVKMRDGRIKMFKWSLLSLKA